MKILTSLLVLVLLAVSPVHAQNPSCVTCSWYMTPGGVCHWCTGTSGAGYWSCSANCNYCTASGTCRQITIEHNDPINLDSAIWRQVAAVDTGAAVTLVLLGDLRAGESEANFTTSKSSPFTEGHFTSKAAFNVQMNRVIPARDQQLSRYLVSVALVTENHAEVRIVRADADSHTVYVTLTRVGKTWTSQLETSR